MRFWKSSVFVTGLLLVAVFGVFAWTSLPVVNDPLVRMPGTQPNQVTLEAPGRCMNCHAGYNTQVEPGFNWQGSMMAQAARDFIFYACMAVAAQDSAWALDRPNAVDICERCHFPQGWLEGRSDPANASLMTGSDFDGVHCDACHRQYNPFFEQTHTGAREGNDWAGYWDETNASSTKSSTAANTTYQADKTQAQAAKMFNGGSFFGLDNLPKSSEYTENGSGQFFISSGNEKRASFADANAKHSVLYSRYHKSKYFCGTCHDVSNPALANLAQNGTPPGNGTTVLVTEQKSAFSYFHVERTFSEFMLSAYAADGGTSGIGPFAPANFKTSLPNNNIGRCQDCHMRDTVGVGCNKSGVPIRPDQSIEHPKSGQPLHDMTGGNIFVSYVLASTVTGSPNYDATNRTLLNQGPAVLTLDLTQGEGINAQALLAGVDRAKQQLELAAAVEGLSYDPASGSISFRLQNQTGHKLISGFPEGRRMFVNIKAYSQGSLIYQVNPYDSTVGTLKGLSSNYSPNSPSLASGEAYVDELVYEMHPTSTVTGEQETFHFALATGRYKDNRIPPKGFRIADAAERLSVPAWHGVEDPDYFTSAEYAGGYDQVTLAIPRNADAVEVKVYYQTTSREYMEFLRDEINGNGRRTLPDTAYIAQTDPFFAKLKAWGNTIWQLWEHNKNLPGAAPYLMTQAAINIDNPCNPPVPMLQTANPGDGQVTINWSNEHSADPNVTGYRIYFDQGGKSQLVDEVGLVTSYTHTGLTNGQLYCYKITALYDECESGFSNILCTMPAPLSTLAQARQAEYGTWLMIDDAVVTAGQSLIPGSLFVESSNRASGIRLITETNALRGYNVRYTGMVNRVDGEWRMESLDLLGSVQATELAPLAMPNRSIGNDPALDLNYTGLNTTGLLVKTWGMITAVYPAENVIYVDDGSGCLDSLGGHKGIRVQVPSGVTVPGVGGYIGVTGISRVEKHTTPGGAEVYVPSVWVRDAGDLRQF